MPRIPTYQAGKLASERTGVGSADTSGVQIAESFTKMAGLVYNAAEDIVTKQKALLKQAELTKLSSQYDSELAILAAEIRRNSLSSPDEANRQLQEKQVELSSLYKEKITDQDVKIRFDAVSTQSNFQEQTRTKLWSLQENSKLIQKTHLDRISADISHASQTDSLDDVLNKAWRLDSDRESFHQAWGGVAEGSNAIDRGQEAMVKAYFYNQLSKGNAYKVLKEIQDGRLGPTEYNWKDGEKQQSNGFLPPEDLVKMKADAQAALMKGRDDAAAITLMSVVNENFNIDEDLRAPLSTTEEKINGLTFEIAKQKERVKDNQVAPEQVATLERQQKYLETIRDQQLNLVESKIVANPEVEADMGAKLAGLFKKKPGAGVAFKGKLDEIYQFQQDLVANRAQIDPKNFNKWNALVKTAFQSEIDGNVKGSKLQTQKSWFGIGKLEAKDKQSLSSSVSVQNALSDFIGRQKGDTNNAFIYESMMFFLDELDERNALQDPSVLQLMNQETKHQLMDKASNKAALKAQDLPLYMNVNDTVVDKRGQRHRITGFKDGRVWVDPEP
jgi:hypothetical protein